MGEVEDIPGVEVGVTGTGVSAAGGVRGKRSEAGRVTGGTGEGATIIAGVETGTSSGTRGGVSLKGNTCSSKVTCLERYNLPVWRSKHLKAC